jgi:hypothetical protein
MNEGDRHERGGAQQVDLGEQLLARRHCEWMIPQLIYEISVAVPSRDLAGIDRWARGSLEAA